MTPSKKLTYKELKKENNRWFLAFFAIGIAWMFSILVLNHGQMIIQKDLTQCQADLNEITKVEVINGNLYVGYFEGIRIGYHQDYNGTWYQCKGRQECEVLE